RWDGAVRLALERLGFRPAAERDRVRTGAARGRRGRHRVARARRRPAWPRPRRRGPPQMSRAPEDFVRSTVRPLAAYGPPRDPAPVPLHLNESPSDVPPELKRELSAQLQAMDWSKYPITDGHRLAADIARACGLNPAGVLVGNGSNELLQLLLFACVEPGDSVVVAAPSFAPSPAGALSHLLEGARRGEPAGGLHARGSRALRRAAQGAAPLQPERAHLPDRTGAHRPSRTGGGAHAAGDRGARSDGPRAERPRHERASLRGE